MYNITLFSNRNRLNFTIIWKMIACRHWNLITTFVITEVCFSYSSFTHRRSINIQVIYRRRFPMVFSHKYSGSVFSTFICIVLFRLYLEMMTHLCLLVLPESTELPACRASCNDVSQLRPRPSGSEFPDRWVGAILIDEAIPTSMMINQYPVSTI